MKPSKEELISSGEFTVDREGYRKAMGIERWKLWRHRVALLWTVIAPEAQYAAGVIFVFAVFGVIAGGVWLMVKKIAPGLDAPEVVIVTALSIVVLFVIFVFVGSWIEETGAKRWREAMARWNEGQDLSDRLKATEKASQEDPGPNKILLVILLVVGWIAGGMVWKQLRPDPVPEPAATHTRIIPGLVWSTSAMTEVSTVSNVSIPPGYCMETAGGQAWCTSTNSEDNTIYWRRQAE